MRAPRDTGMTLVEMLVVLAIVGAMASVAVLGLGATDRGLSAEIEAKRLASHLRLAADEAMITGRRLALQSDERGYAFVAWDGAAGGWTVAPRLGERHELPGDMTLEGEALSPIATDGAGRPIDVAIAEPSGAPWRVTFDGLNVATIPPAGA